MLKNIDPLLTPELLKVLAEMGHGDEIVLADANFTAVSLGRGKPVLRLPGAGMAQACAGGAVAAAARRHGRAGRWPTCRSAAASRATARRCSAR